ncbi:MAG: methyltransferase domain-containing protein [Actinomycetota bacterium]|nr:methyltransferase domain-containing protein [Actinomycetota bacterium]
MSRRCNARGCDAFFGARFAARAARRYRKKGLDKTARRIVEFLASRGIEGATVLEIGGGVGEIEIELLKRGAARAVNLELSPAYEEEAKRLPSEQGLEERVDWRVHDIAADPDPVEPADVVVLHRVVCCYPDYRTLLGAAAAHARRSVVFSYPPRHAVSRLFIGAQNLVFRLLRREFRTFAHPPAAMLEVVEERGFRRVFAHRAPVWQIAALERADRRGVTQTP